MSHTSLRLIENKSLSFVTQRQPTGRFAKRDLANNLTSICSVRGRENRGHRPLPPKVSRGRSGSICATQRFVIDLVIDQAFVGKRRIVRTN